jgi:SAM-dependent methyltransferase
MLMMRVGLFLSLLLLVNGQSVDTRDRDFWNGKFSDPKTQFRRKPSRLLAGAISGRQPGRALDLGMGEGRNTIFLAQQGWDATGVDLSDVAVAQAKTRAAQLHVRITATVDGLDHYEPGKNNGIWLRCSICPLGITAQSQRAKRLFAALKPGGLLVMEGFAGREKFMFQPNELLRDFPELRVLRYEDTEDEAEWAPGQRSHIIRFVPEKVK